MCLSKFEQKSKDILERPLNLNSLDESLWNDKCDYLDLHSATYLNPSGLNLVILELNMRSILSHLSDLKQLLHVLESKNSRADIILLCETFLTKSTENLVKVPGYTLICSNRKHSKGGGTAILLQNGITFKRRTDIEIFREKDVESTIIEIVAKDGKKIVVCSMYRPPNTDPTHFITSMNSITSKLASEKKEIILGMDHNLDLLKSGSHKQTQLFLNDLLDKEIYPTITRPTRICHNAATLIDNVFVSKNLHKFFESAILIEDISDHLPLLILLKQTKLICNKPIEFKTRKLNAKNIKLIKYKLYQVDWTKHL